MLITRRGGNLRTIMAVAGFRRLLGTRLVSQYADGLFQAGLGGSLLFNPARRTGALTTAAAFALLLVPYSLVGPYVGVFLDRWDRRNVVYGANLLRAALVLPSAVCLWSGYQGPGYGALALCVIGVNRFFLSGLSAAQPHVVEPDRLVTANALATTLGTVLYSLGLGSAALALNTVLPKDFHGYAGLAVVAAVGYAGSGLLAHRSFQAGQLGPDEADRHGDSIVRGVVEVARGMVAGLRHVAGRRWAGYGILVQSVHRGLYGVLTLATLLLYRNYFFGGDLSQGLAGLAEIVVAGGIGALGAAFLTPPLARRIGGWRQVTGLFALAGVVIFALALPFRPTLLVVAVFFVNLASQSTKIVVDTAIQQDCADEFRGRVFSVNDTLYNLSFVAGMFAAAAVLPANGHSVPAIVLVSVGYLLLAGWYGAACARLARSGRVGS